MDDITKKYSNGDITIVWKPQMCIHSTLCWKGEPGLRSVFNPSERPWIKPDQAPTEEIITRVNNCPSGALSFYYNADGEQPAESTVDTIVETILNGPLMVYGNIELKNSDGTTTRRHKVTAFCRCGASANKPFCDGTHVKVGFNG